MSAWNPARLTTSLSKGDLAPIYLFYGDETFLIDELLENLKSLALGDGLPDFNLDVFYAQSTEVSSIRDAIETLPMMAERRVVVLKEAQDLKEKDWTELYPILENPVDSTVFICVASKIDKRRKYAKFFQDRGILVEFHRPFENQIPEWIVKLAKREKLKLDVEAVSLLQQIVGSYLSDLHNEIVKLGQYLGDNAKVTVDDVLRVVSKSRIENVFELSTAIGQQDRVKALLCLANLLEHGQNEVGILTMVHRHLRKLKVIKQGWREGLTGMRLAQRAGVPQFFLKQYEEQARLWNEKKMEAGFKALLDTDRALKSSPISSHIWLENFILHTCN